ncbi:MAG: TetR family transcriptional regulator, partial [Ilumatobacteraceae bacterium]|nr:TetR family transcriptional regulator [Ilumatobacteraceae bacterium]
MAEYSDYRSPAHLSVLDAARSCVDSSGFVNVTMDDICEAATASRATVYR